MKINTKLATILITLIAITGCGETKLLGAKQAPDELEVVDAPPLSLPPSFELRPPKKGQVVLYAEGNEEARDIILGNKTTLDVNQPVQKLQIKPVVSPQSDNIAPTKTVPNQPAKEATVDSWLVKKSGGEASDSNIRQEVQADFEVEEQENSTGWFSQKFGKKARETRALERDTKIAEEYDKVLESN